jgi:putative acetyltransferase
MMACPIYPPGLAMRQLAVRRESIESRDAHELIMALNAELAHRYPEPGANHFRLDHDAVLPGRGAFVIARDDRLPVGCGAIRRMDPTTAEIKRMYVVPKHRGMGAGHAILEKLEHVARELGVTRIVLETGERQPDAIALYEHSGFVRIQPFGEYVDSPLSVCMEKVLVAAK